MAYTVSPKDDMFNISGKHLVQKKKRKEIKKKNPPHPKHVGKVPTYTRTYCIWTVSFNFVFSINNWVRGGEDS